jgi:phenylacetate-CoA ligase
MGLQSLYARLPVWGQHAAVTAFGAYWYWARFGGTYAADVAMFEARDRWTAQRWHDWQRAALRELLVDAAAHVPYYRDSWRAAERRAASRGELGALPFLFKDPLRSHPWAFVRDDRRVRRPLVHHTSGSTGTPIASIWTRAEHRRALALREARSARWAGVSFQLPRATVSGRMVEPDPDSRGPYHRYNAVERQVYLSAYHLRAETAAAYLDALLAHDVRWMTGYASTFYFLAQYVLEQGLRAPRLDAIVTTSEPVTPAMRRVMQEAFGGRVYEEYSTVENVVFASECSHGRLHVSPDAGVVEIVRPDGTPCEVGEVGEIAATCLLRSYQPFIRYRLGDLAAWDPAPCPCGRRLPVFREVIGRLEDVLVGPDGRKLMRFSHLFTEQPVREAQVVQEQLDRIRLLVVPAADYTPAVADDMAERLRQRLGPVHVEVELVASLPRTAAGKAKAVVSHLPKSIDRM